MGYFAYNFIKFHRTLRVTPAMAAGVTDRLWDVADLVAAWEDHEQRIEKSGLIQSRDTIVAMRHGLLSMLIGAVVEVIVFFSLLPKDSTQRPTTWEMLGEYTQAPFASVFNGLSLALEHLPSPLLSTGATLIFGVAFLTQAAVFGLPILLLASNLARRKKSPRFSK